MSNQRRPCDLFDYIDKILPEFAIFSTIKFGFIRKKSYFCNNKNIHSKTGKEDMEANLTKKLFVSIPISQEVITLAKEIQINSYTNI